MKRPAAFAFDSQNILVREVALRTGLILLLLAAVVGGILHFSTSRSDAIALERQARLARIAVDQSLSAIARDQEASTYWDDAVLRTRQRPLDLEWIDNNLGIWFHTYYRHDETYLLDPEGRAIYAMQYGARATNRSFARLSGQVAPMALRLRQLLRNGYLASEGAAGKTIGVAGVVRVANRPAYVSIKPIVSETGDVPQRAGSEYLHVSVRYLDGDFLTRLSNLYGIDEAHFSWSRTGDASIPVLTGADGEQAGYIGWSPFDPGEQVEDKMAPVLFVSLMIVGIIIGLLIARIRRSRMDLEASRAQAQHLAFHDSLTGLPNRALFEDRLEHSLSRRRAGSAVLLLDLDRFKNVNDTLGHQAGDELIREFGLRLSRLTREGDTIARLGGDEFAILLEDARPRDAHSLARRILGEVARPFELFGSEAHVGVSIGIALAADAQGDRLELVRKADIALYRAKDGGRNNYCLFSAEMDDSVKLRSRIEDELRQALATGRGLCVHYQPQIGSQGSVIGLEALVRWDHPTRGLIAPEQFVPIAEESGLILPLGEWVLRQACSIIRQWPQLFVSVNLSPLQLRSSSFVERLLSIVHSSGIDPASLQLEVTERLLGDDDESSKSALAELRASGFRIVLDDFGTGYSSLSYLRKFEVDKIKIDRSFVQHLGEASDSSAIVTAVLALGHALGLKVAAEGVETAEQRSFLEIAGCSEMQGFYFSRAVPADALPGVLAGRGAKPAAA